MLTEYYYAKAGSSKSNVEKISVIAKLIEAELVAIRKVNTSLENLRNSDNYKAMSIDDRRKDVLELLNQFIQEGLIKATSI